MNWNYDIDAAPMDGTRCLVLMPPKMTSKKGNTIQNRKHGIAIARWVIPPENTPVNFRKKELLDKHGGYWSAHHKGMRPIYRKPIAWMLLDDILPKVTPLVGQVASETCKACGGMHGDGIQCPSLIAK